MVGITDLLRLSSALPPPGEGQAGLGASIEAAGNLLHRLVTGIETLVEIERPALSCINFIPTIGGPYTNTPFGPTAIVSKTVDVYAPSFNTSAMSVQFLDENSQPSAFQRILFYPGDFRSFSIRSRGFLISSTDPIMFQVTYWI